METLNTNNYSFNLIEKENERLVYISNNINKKIKNRIEFEKFIHPIALDFCKMLDNDKTKEAFLNIYAEYDENKKIIGYNQYKIAFKEDEKILTINRLSFGKKWRVKYNFFKIMVDISLIN